MTVPWWALAVCLVAALAALEHEYVAPRLERYRRMRRLRRHYGRLPLPAERRAR
jgi:membrane protein YdbS with pleckstrin-like domain